MKILYAVQATGNGHLSRCMEFYPYLCKHGEVDVLLSGIQGDLNLPFEVKYKMHGLGFIFGKNGGIDYTRTLLSLKPLRFIKDLLRLKVSDYDIVVNDFEPISAWKCKFVRIKCVSISHQAAFLSKKSPRPAKKNFFGEFLFRHFAPSVKAIGLHFKSYDKDIFTPSVRTEIRELKPAYVPKEVLVYLPAYSEEPLIQHFKKVPDYTWKIFSKHVTEYSQEGNVYIFPVGTENWNKALTTCPNAIMGGGFEGPSEMLFLHKRLMVIPMPDQYEQLCNAAALEEMGVKVVHKIEEDFSTVASDWLNTSKIIQVDFPHQSDLLVRKALGFG